MAETDKQQRPPLRSNFDLEPNPFEQSFSSTRTTANDSSSSSVSTQASLKRDASEPAGNAKGETPKPMLPPLSSMASPSDGSYAAWGMSASDMNSLRAGPLSPAMLAGPQQHHQSLSSFEFGRTGLTPSTGLTPLVGANSSYPPPPSPNTAAFFAMVSNTTTVADLAASTAATITPNTLNAITGALNQTAAPQSYQTFVPPRQQDYQSNGQTADTGSQVNGLFLLSQAHQELAKREEATKRASTIDEPAMNPQASVEPAPQTRRSTKRKSTDAQAPAPPVSTRASNKKPRTSSAASKPKRGKRAESMSDDDDDIDMDSDDEMMFSQSPSATKTPRKPETEEEKRRNFLERNRQAALKCRQRKKAWLTQLQAKTEFLSTENERLNAALLKSSEEINRLTALVNAANVVPSSGGPGAPVSVSMQSSHKTEPMPMTAVVGGGRGYGY